VSENGPGRPPGETPGAPPLSPSDGPAGSQPTAGAVIHLGGSGRTRTGTGVGELAPYSQTAFGLSALGRAQARARRTAGPSSSVGPVFGRSRRARRVGRTRRRAARRDSLNSRRGLHRSRRPRRLLRSVLLVVLAVGIVAAAAVVFVGVQLRRPAPPPSLEPAVQASRTVVGPVPRLAWPASVEAAVDVRGMGPVGQAGPTSPVPIASLAKVMTAMVLLRDHPLVSGQPGPEVPITAADQATYQADLGAGDSVAPVAAGETLSELQLLEGLLIPSADNLASVVARWDAGGQAAFVAKMNATASAYGMRATHYADPSGVSASTVSTAGDQLLLAERAAASPVLMSIVRQPTLVFPDAVQLLTNYNGLLGQDGIVGIKTGDTTAAGGCFMFAANAATDGHSVEVLGVVLGARGTPLIASALHAGQSLIGPTVAGLHPITALPAGTVVAHVTDAWGGSVAVKTARPVTILGIGPTSVRWTVAAKGQPVAVGLPAGSEVATVSVAAGGQVQTVAAVTDQTITGPSRRWRVERV
jgi:serine-type D-Ala-D-Ala carboxypeptidase (penicillin-binding protein 5/6)